MRTTQNEEIQTIIAPLLDSMSLSLWGMELLTGGPRTVLRIYVEGSDGVSIDECAKLSRHIGLALDVEDTMQDAYTLEVSSPGLERPFFTPEQVAKYAGKPVECVLKDAHPDYAGRRKFAGTVHMAEDQNVVLELQAEKEGEKLSLHWDDIKKIKLVHIFPDTSKEASRAKKK